MTKISEVDSSVDSRDRDSDSDSESESGKESSVISLQAEERHKEGEDQYLEVEPSSTS